MGWHRLLLLGLSFVVFFLFCFVSCSLRVPTLKFPQRKRVQNQTLVFSPFSLSRYSFRTIVHVFFFPFFLLSFFHSFLCFLCFFFILSIFQCFFFFPFSFHFSHFSHFPFLRIVEAAPSVQCTLPCWTQSRLKLEDNANEIPCRDPKCGTESVRVKRGRSAYKNRWIDEYKLKGGAWIVRSCLVAQELVTDGRNDTFAGTPPLKAVTLGLVLASTQQFRIEAEQKSAVCTTFTWHYSTPASTARNHST